jgi:hypothetical protein
LKVRPIRKGRFFNAMNPIPITKKEIVSLKSPPKPERESYVADKVSLSDNIRKFDEKVKNKVFTKNPFDHNSISIKDHESVASIPTASEMIASPTYNQIGKILGVDTLHEWGIYYDKVYEVTKLAEEKSQITDTARLSSWILDQMNNAPSLGGKRINDVHIYLKVGGIK